MSRAAGYAEEESKAGHQVQTELKRFEPYVKLDGNNGTKKRIEEFCKKNSGIKSAIEGAKQDILASDYAKQFSNPEDLADFVIGQVLRLNLVYTLANGEVLYAPSSARSDHASICKEFSGCFNDTVAALRLITDNNHAKICLADCYMEGIGAGVNKRSAFNIAQDLMGQNYAPGQCMYARCLDNGIGVEKSSEEAARYYALAAEQGYAPGQYTYGYCLQYGDGVTKNLTEAARYYKLAADQGNAFGQYKYGVCLQNGVGVGKDPKEAARYYKLAAEQGSAPGQCNYGYCLNNGEGVEKNSEEAARYYKLAADQGNARAQFEYGSCLKNGVGVDKDPKESARYYKLAAYQGNALGQCNYGYCLDNGIGVDRSPKEAARYYKLAADQGNAFGQYKYGFCLQNGVGVDKDPKEAARYYKLAADQGHPAGQRGYGFCLKNGVGIDKDPKEAARYYTLAADQGRIDAQQDLCDLGVSCLNGSDGVKRDTSLGILCIARAAAKGNVTAESYLFGDGKNQKASVAKKAENTQLTKEQIIEIIDAFNSRGDGKRNRISNTRSHIIGDLAELSAGALSGDDVVAIQQRLKDVLGDDNATKNASYKTLIDLYDSERGRRYKALDSDEEERKDVAMSRGDGYQALDSDEEESKGAAPNTKIRAGLETRLLDKGRGKTGGKGWS